MKKFTVLYLVLAALFLLSTSIITKAEGEEGASCTPESIIQPSYDGSFVCGNQGQTTYTGSISMQYRFGGTGNFLLLTSGAEGIPCGKSMYTYASTGMNFTLKYWWVKTRVGYYVSGNTGSYVVLDEDMDIGCSWSSPIVMSMTSNQESMRLTNSANGVDFDMLNLGTTQRWAWTEENEPIGFLAIDLNNDGKITVTEMFGDNSEQATPLYVGEPKSGYRSLRRFDNGDNVIDSNDFVFGSLIFWIDSNHNGLSEAEEKLSLSSAEVRSIPLNYYESRRRDKFGNFFRFCSSVNMQNGSHRPACDVFLTGG